MDYIRIGIVSKAQGIRGEVKVTSLSDNLERFLKLKYVFLQVRDEYSRVGVKGVRLGDNCAFLLLEHVYTRDAAEQLRGAYVCVDKENLMPLPKGRYYIFDLIGCTVETADGKVLGKLTEVLQPGANDVYVVNGEEEILIPVIKSVVLETDIIKKRIVVDGNMLQEVVVYED